MMVKPMINEHQLDEKLTYHIVCHFLREILFEIYDQEAMPSNINLYNTDDTGIGKVIYGDNTYGDITYNCTIEKLSNDNRFNRIKYLKSIDLPKFSISILLSVSFEDYDLLDCLHLSNVRSDLSLSKFIGTEEDVLKFAMTF